MKWLASLLLSLCLAATPAFATDVAPIVRSATLLTSVGSAVAGPTVDVGTFNAMGILITGISSATVQFEVSMDGTNWTARLCNLASSASQSATATANGNYQCTFGGFKFFRLNVTVWSSGTITATGVLTTLGAGTGGGGPGGGGGTLTVKDIDGTPTISGVTTIQATNGSVTDNGGGNVTIATGSAANIVIGTTTVTGGTAGSLLTVGAGPLFQQVNLTGLVLGNGASQPSAYPGATCTAQVIRILSASGAATCATITSAYVDTSVWTGSVASGLLKAASQGVVAQAVAGTDYIVSVAGTANQINISGAGGALTATLSSTLVIPGPTLEFTETAGDQTCAAGDYWIKANSTATKLRKCEAGIVSDLDTNTGGGGGAPVGATYITQTGDGTLSSEQALSSLPTALLRNTTTTGVLVAYGGTSCTNQVLRMLDLTGGGTCVTLTSAYVDTSIAVTGASNTWAAGVKQTFAPNATSAGFNPGSAASDPSAGANGDIYYNSGSGKFRCYQASTWTDCVTAGGGSPTTATYITQTADGTLSNEQVLGSLATALLVNTTTTGVLTAYPGASCTNQVVRVLSAIGGATCATITSAFVDSSIAVTGASNSWGDGIKQTFNPNGTNAGLNVGAQAGDPSTPANGDVWYNSSTGKFRCYENGATTNCIGAGGAGTIGGTTGGTDNAVLRADGAGGATVQTSLCTVDDTGTMTCPGGFIGGTSGTGVVTLLEGTAPGAGTSTGEHNFYVDSADSKLKSHENGGSIVTYAITGANSWVDGTRQTFNPNDTNSGFNPGSNALDPSGPANGDMFYNSTSGLFRFYESGAWRGLGITGEADTAQTVHARGGTVTTANSFATAHKVEDGTGVGTAIYTDGIDGPQQNCYTPVENDCHYYRKLLAGKEFGVKNASGTKILTVSNDTGVMTNVSIDGEGVGTTLTLPFKYNIKPVGCTGTTGTLLLDTNATLAPTATCTAGSTNTTLMQSYADFPDLDGEYQFQDKFRLPIDWPGTSIDLQIYWKSAATTGDVVWQVATLCRADAEIEDAAWNTAQAFAADTAKGTTLQLNTVSLTGLTTTGCAGGEMFYFKIFRQRTHASDTITGVVSLSHAELTIRRGT